MRVGARILLGWLAVAAMVSGGAGCAKISGLFKRHESAPAADASRIPLRLERTSPYGGAGTTASTGVGTNVAVRPDIPAVPGMEIYRLRPQDTIIVTIHNPVSTATEMTVDENGFIKLPLIENVKAAGLTPAELEKSIREAYLNGKFYKYVTVNVNLPIRSYFISGEVKQPGRFPLLSGVTLRQALAAAGGYTDFADREKIEIKRGSNIIRFSAKAIDKGEQEDITIETGDVINVGRSWY